MIYPVVVESNRTSLLTHALALGLHLWVSTEGSCKQIFFAPFSSAVPHTIASIYMDGVGENIGQRHHPVGNPRRLCAWYCIRQGDMVRQDPYRMKRILKGKLVHSVHGLKGRGFSPLGKLLSKGK
jgi:hypothetical protein